MLCKLSNQRNSSRVILYVVFCSKSSPGQHRTASWLNIYSYLTWTTNQHHQRYPQNCCTLQSIDIWHSFDGLFPSTTQGTLTMSSQLYGTNFQTTTNSIVATVMVQTHENARRNHQSRDYRICKRLRNWQGDSLTIFVHFIAVTSLFCIPRFTTATPNVFTIDVTIT